MDESTSALDEETEEALYQVLAAKLPGTTLVSVDTEARCSAITSGCWL